MGEAKNRHHISSGITPNRYNQELSEHRQNCNWNKLLTKHVNNDNAHELIRRGDKFLETKEFEQAMISFEQAIAILSTQNDQVNSAIVLNKLGDVCRLSNRYKAAIQFWDHSAQTYENNGCRLEKAKIILKLGYLNLKLGEYIQGKDYLENALLDFRELAFLQGESWANAYLGLLHHQIDDDEAAMVHIRLALRVTQEIGDQATHADALTFQGHSLVRMGQFTNARGAYDYAISLLSSLKQRGLGIDALAGLSRLLFATGNYAAARNQVDQIMHLISIAGLEGVIEPIRTMLTCYTILNYVKDPRANSVLDDCHTLLLNKADLLSDPKMRRTFLENITAHRNALQFWTYIHSV